MSLRQKQSIFARNISKLIIWAFDNGYEITLGEGYRTNDQQLLYFYGYTLDSDNNSLNLLKTSQKSKTMNSYHLSKCALDINLFIDGDYKSDRGSFKAIAEHWKSLNDKNVSGYDWGWDYNHFQMS